MAMARQRAKRFAPLAWLAGWALVFCTLAALAYPALSGRIVDAANVIDAGTKAALEPKLAELESKSGIQLVVATVPSLGGQEIEPYANTLFRTWAIGQKVKNNGVLLLVAPTEHRVRIEVGYGLEGTLTDALSKVVIANAMAPRFKANNFSDGISRGVDDIITILTTDSADWQAQQPSLRLDNGSQSGGDIGSWIIAALIFMVLVLLVVSPLFRSVVFQILLQVALSSGNSRGGGGFSGGSGGGGFSGGGGSSGGGGASGSW